MNNYEPITYSESFGDEQDHSDAIEMERFDSNREELAIQRHEELMEQAHELFNDEMNWNNCDKTSGQYVKTAKEIYEQLKGEKQW